MPFFRITYRQEIFYHYDLVAIDGEDAAKIADNMGSFVMPTSSEVVVSGKTTGVDQVEEINYEEFKEAGYDGHSSNWQENSRRAELSGVV